MEHWFFDTDKFLVEDESKANEYVSDKITLLLTDISKTVSDVHLIVLTLNETKLSDLPFFRV